MTDIIVIGIIGICLFAIIYSYVKKVKRGETTGCNGGCSGCSSKGCSSHNGE